MKEDKRAIYLRKLDDATLAIIDKHREDKKIKPKTEAVLDMIKKYPQQQLKIEKQEREIKALKEELYQSNVHLSNLDSLISFIKSRQ